MRIIERLMKDEGKKKERKISEGENEKKKE